MENNEKNLAERVKLRPVEMPADEEFLIELYYTTRDDIQEAPLEEDEKRALSLMQYQLQRQHYLNEFPDTDHDMILLDGKPVGRLWIARYDDEIIGVDLAIMPEYRNIKIGTFLLENLFDEAQRTNRIFNFHVLKTNVKAMRLYERLNCKFTGETFSHFKMQWQGRENKSKKTKNRKP